LQDRGFDAVQLAAAIAMTNHTAYRILGAWHDRGAFLDSTGRT